MADLRRQEILLNDEERKIKGAEQIRITEEKASPEKQQEAIDRSAILETVRTGTSGIGRGERILRV